MGYIDKHRVTTALDDEDFLALEHWSKAGNMSTSEFIKEAIQFRIKWKCKDYPLPPMEIQRLNQLVDGLTVLSENVRSLESVVTSGFDSLLGLTRGDGYLLEEVDGDISD